MRYLFHVFPALLLAFVPPTSAHAFCNVRLNNGEVLQAEDFGIEKDKITLIYKTGCATFPRSMVSSIMDEKGETDFLATRGDAVTHTPEKPAEPMAATDNRPDWPQRADLAGGRPTSPAGTSGLRRDPDPGVIPPAAQTDAGAKSSDPDDPSFYDGMDPDDAAFLKGEKDITEFSDNGVRPWPSSPGRQ